MACSRKETRLASRVQDCRTRRRGGFWQMRHYMSAHLHRKLFLAIGFAIFATMGSAIFILHVGSDKTPWDREFHTIETFFSGRFERVWEDEVERTLLAKTAANAFHARVQLNDKNGAGLGRFGGSCHGPSWSFDVKRKGVLLGTVDACSTRGPGKKNALLGFVVACVVLWLIAGVIARKLAQPLRQLTAVTHEIGQGKLSARARLGQRHVGEVGELAESINEMAERIERQMKGQRELLAGVSHEVRTPLARLRVLTEILRDRDVDEKALADIELEISEIDALVGQLLANSRLEFESVDRSELDVVTLAQLQLRRLSLPEDKLTTWGTSRVVPGDATLVARAMINLMENAEKHGGGLLDFRVEFLANQVRCVAIDDGPGFTEDERKRAFDSFFRGKSSGKSASSLGLGLSLVQRIAQAHGGTTSVKNRAQGGAEVCFSLSTEASVKN